MLTEELDRKATKKRKISEEAHKAVQQDGRIPCEPIEDTLDDYSSHYVHDN